MLKGNNNPVFNSICTIHLCCVCVWVDIAENMDNHCKITVPLRLVSTGHVTVL